MDPAQTNYVQVTENAKESGRNGDHERLYAEVEVQQAGYLYIYLSNDNYELQGEQVDVFFDDFQIQQVHSKVVQSDDYYPFGLTFNSYSRENTTPQDYKYNGKELQDELNLGWLDYGARMYQPEIGRWNGIDKRAHNYMMYSPYGYVANNPTNNVDYNGEFILPKAFLNRFQRIAQYLASDIQGILNNKRIVNALKKHGGFTDKQLKEAFTWGQGPTLTPGNFADPDILGITGGVPGDVSISINIDLFEALEKAEGKDRDYLLFLTAVTILHEYVHYGYIENKVQNDAVEEGYDFERDAYGKVIDRKNHREVLDKWLEKRRPSQSSSSTGFGFDIWVYTSSTSNTGNSNNNGNNKKSRKKEPDADKESAKRSGGAH